MLDHYTKVEDEIEKKQKMLQTMQTNLGTQMSESLAFKTSDYLQGVYEVVGQKQEAETVVETRKLDYELLERWIEYMEKPTDKYKYKEAWQAMMKRTLAAAARRRSRGTRRRQRPATPLQPMPRRRRACDRSRARGGAGGSVGAFPAARRCGGSVAAADAAAAGRRGGGNAEVKKLADEFQENVVKVMLARKELNEENEVIIAKSLEGTKKKKRANKPNEFITNDDFCPNCGLRLKNMPEDENNFWTEVFQRELRDSDDPAAMMAMGGTRRQARRSAVPRLGAGKPHRRRAAGADGRHPHRHRRSAQEARAGLSVHARRARTRRSRWNLPLAIRGNPENLGPGSAAPLPQHSLAKASRTPFSKGSGRLELAEDILKQPIAMRVIVNRIWKGHFGTGIVDTPEQLRDHRRAAHQSRSARIPGQLLREERHVHQEAAPRDHAELGLPALERERRGQLPPRIPATALYWRFDRKRLEAEQLRDAVLLVSGNLDKSLGGPSADLTPGLYAPHGLRQGQPL